MPAARSLRRRGLAPINSGSFAKLYRIVAGAADNSVLADAAPTSGSLFPELPWASLLPQSNPIAVGIQGSHPHTIGVVLGLRLDELDAARPELAEVLPKVVRLKKDRAHFVLLGSCAASCAGPKQDRPSLTFVAHQQESALRPGVIGHFLEAEVTRVEVERLFLI